jgi:hypothetical protein
MSSNINMNDISATVQNETPTGAISSLMTSTQSYDVNKEQNSKVRFLMSYYGY